VIGGGIVGLATARALAELSLPVLVLEAEGEVGRHQTGHNSGVLHSGLYYAPGSLKARLTVQGRQALEAFCDQEGVLYRRTGKLVVAVGEDELPRLLELERRGRANGLVGLERLGPEALRERFPWVSGVAALWVAETGITDFRAVAAALARRLAASGCPVRTGAQVLAVEARGGEQVVETTAGAFPVSFVVGCAGLQGDRVARLSGLAPVVRIVPFRGEYHHLTGAAKPRVTLPVYPVPDPRFPFLGVHLTPTVEGKVEAGPNAVLALSRNGYQRGEARLRDLWEMATFPGLWRFGLRHLGTALEEERRSRSRERFARSVARLVPEITAADLSPGGAGLRAQALSRGGRLVDDFLFAEGPRAVHVLNAPSPAATAALAIGREIARAVARRLGGGEAGPPC
jgi:L-2-hydroxyglutarate oxidase